MGEGKFLLEEEKILLLAGGIFKQLPLTFTYLFFQTNVFVDDKVAVSPVRTAVEPDGAVIRES
jgi:hypothetical protein